MKHRRSLMTTMKWLPKQAGASLTSLLIGLLISSIGILGSSKLYSNLVQVTMNSTQDASRDGQLALTTLSIQRVLHSAGYGIANADESQVSVDGTTKLYWRYTLDDGATFTCQYLEDKSVVDSINADISNRQLVLNTMTGGDCNTDLATAQGSTGGWQPSVIAEFRNQNAAIFSFAVAGQDCSPYGMLPAERKALVTMTTTNSTQAFNGWAGNSYDFCLSNITHT